jgi:glycosyltransferase involved in cell wall biosynthesis
VSGPVHALQVIDTLGMGGAETWLMEVLRLWAKTGAGRMDFLATSGEPGLFDEEARGLGAHIHYVPYGKRHLPTFTRAFRKLLAEGDFDAVHDHQDYASGWHFLLGGRALPPIRVTHVHNPAYQIRNNYGVTFSRRATAAAGRRLVARYATHITGTSRQAIAEYGFDGPRFAAIPKAALYCGLDPARFAGPAGEDRAAVRREFGWPEDAKLILFAGRIDQSPDLDHPQNHKNSGFAVSAAIEAALRDPAIHMIMAGAPSPAVAVLQARIAEAGLGGRISIAGIRSDIARLMRASDVLLFPSRGEGLGMVCVEAQAGGLPVLASSAVPRESVVIPKLVQFLDVEAGPEAWATALIELAARKVDRAQANAVVAASPFAIENSAAALARLYGGGGLQ